MVPSRIPHTSDATLDALRDSAESIYQHYLPDLQRAGTSLRARCPFHDERTGSLSVRAHLYHCFGCGVGGDVFAFVMKIANCTFPQAVTIAARITGVVVAHTVGRQTSETEWLNDAREHFYEWRRSALVRVARELRTRDTIVRQIDRAVHSGLLTEEHAVNFLAREYDGYSELEHVFNILHTGTGNQALQVYLHGQNEKY